MELKALLIILNHLAKFLLAFEMLINLYEIKS